MKMTDNNYKFEDKYVGALGRRKTSVAQVRLYKRGKGNIFVNGKPMDAYFTKQAWRDRILAPLKKVGMAESTDISVKVLGGGISGQADAVRLGVSRALLKIDEELRASLKSEGFLSRDARKKERKKPGLKKARRAPQWSKR